MKRGHYWYDSFFSTKNNYLRFNKNGLHKLADGGATDAVVTQITKRVNGGTIGLADRIKHFKEYYHLLA
jgi:putative chitinase